MRLGGRPYQDMGQEARHTAAVSRTISVQELFILTDNCSHARRHFLDRYLTLQGTPHWFAASEDRWHHSHHTEVCSNT